MSMGFNLHRFLVLLKIFKVYVCDFVSLCAAHACRCWWRPEGIRSPGTRVGASCEQPAVGLSYFSSAVKRYHN